MKKFSVCTLVALVLSIGSTAAFAASSDRCAGNCGCFGGCGDVTNCQGGFCGGDACCQGGVCGEGAGCQGGACGEPLVALTYPEPYDGRERRPRGITIRVVPPRPAPRWNPPRRVAPPPRLLPPRPLW